MNTFDNLYNLLTIIINKRRCSSDEKKTNDQCPEHCMTIWCILKYLLLLLLWSIWQKLNGIISHYVHLNEESTWMSARWTTIETKTGRRMGWAYMLCVASCCYCRFALCDHRSNERIFSSVCLSLFLISPFFLFRCPYSSSRTKENSYCIEIIV
jgi:hypothetical protein